MAGDLDVMEAVALNGNGAVALTEGAAVRAVPRVIHRYGQLSILAVPGGETPAGVVQSRALGASETDGLGELERLGLAALRLRESEEFRKAKENRPRTGEDWDMPSCTTVVPLPAEARAAIAAADAAAAAPTSSYLEGTVAVGIVIVQGPTAALQFTDAEITKVIAEVQNGLGFYATTNPVAGISFNYDIQNVGLAVQPDPTATDLEAVWRNPAMGMIGFSADWAGVTAYVEDLRSRFGTRWTYCGFFTKYPLNHFAYASIGGPRLVMDYNNDGWGPDNIDRVFAHETGHIFGCPDEYASSGCDCGGSWGRYGIVNGNCENCAAGGGVACLMKANTFAVCGFTPSHLGWAPQLEVRNFGFTAGGWRIDQHPRVMADTTGDHRADIVGFGNAGVWISRAQADGRYETPQLRIANFGATAGGWRVDTHPRFLADTTGDGRADVVGFGTAGVYVSRAQADGSFDGPTFRVANFGSAPNAGGWRVDTHPRMLADTTGDGRADIVGFGTAGVYVSVAQPDGSFDGPTFRVANFGSAPNAGGWRVDTHPRTLADTTGDGRADIVGFGTAGVYVSRSQPDGSFDGPTMVVGNFGSGAGAGGWRVDTHPRFVVDINHDGKAEIVGFGTGGVWVSYPQADGSYSNPVMVVANFGSGAGAGGWRIDTHPRFLADTTGDGLLDIVGCGTAGVYVSRALADGTYEAPRMVIANYASGAGGWRVDQHPRFLADINGDGRADVLGFGNAGVYVSRF